MVDGKTICDDSDDRFFEPLPSDVVGGQAETLVECDCGVSKIG
jgi:hypothetical protein